MRYFGMSLHDNFAHSDHPGFTRSIDPQSARRQLRVSVGVVAVLAMAIGASAVAIHPSNGFDAASQRSVISAATVTGHHDLNAGIRIVAPNRS